MKASGTVAESAYDVYPRALRPKERDLLEFVLPASSAGYARYRELLGRFSVIGEGRRGKGNIVLGQSGDVADIDSPLAHVVAYGVVETTLDTFTITLREESAHQIDVEIISGSGEEIPDHFEEKRRWTYSGWKPGQPSPATGLPVREVIVTDALSLAFSAEERRLWLHDGHSLMNILIPITNFYNELMLAKSMRDPAVALKSSLLFENLGEYADQDLRAAFIAYNKLHHKVEIAQQIPAQQEPVSFLQRLRRIFRKQ